MEPRPPEEADDAEASTSLPKPELLKLDPPNWEAPAAALRAPFTPVHYVRCHFGPPELPADFALEVTGAVERPLRLTVAELARLPHVELPVTLECAGNGRSGMQPLPPGEPWGLGAVSTALWGGTPLAGVLASAGLLPEAREVRFRGADRGRPADRPGSGPIAFERSLPLDKALAPETMLAWERNRAPLTPEHGAPLRLLVPGWFGMASVKWLERIEVATAADGPFAGWFQADRYVYRYGDEQPPEPVRELRVRALLTRPLDGAVLPRGEIVLRGWAWSGAGEVSAVEVATAGGDAWQPARLGPSVGRWAWRGFSYHWRVEAPGRYLLRVRARDQAGHLQPDRIRYNQLGYGNHAVATTRVQIV